MNLGFVLKLSLSIVVTGLTLSADNIKISENLYIRFIIALPLEIRRQRKATRIKQKHISSYVAVAAIEIPAYIALPLIIDVWGRSILSSNS